MAEDVLFRDLKVNDKPIYECEIAYQDDYDNLRLYVDIDRKTNSFWAKLVSFNSCTSICIDVWEDHTLTVDVVLDVVAYWDGIRHLTPSYTNYPDVKKLADVYSVLAFIEDGTCTETCRSPRIQYDT